MVFPVVMYGCESWTIKKVECQRIDAFVLRCWRLLRILGPQGDPPENPNGNQPRIFIGGADVEAKTPILWPPDGKKWLTGKDPDVGKDWRQEEKGWQRIRFGWHHWLNGHEFEQALGVCDGPGSLTCCSPWGHSQTWLSDWTELKTT